MVQTAVVFSAAALPKLTPPGPLTLFQRQVTTPGGLGRPSSVTVASKLIWFEGHCNIGATVQALTVGARFVTTLIVTSAVPLKMLSLALSRKT